MPEYAQLLREELADGVVLLMERFDDRMFYVFTVPPCVGDAPVYHYRGAGKDEAIAVFADILASDMMDEG